MTDTGSFFTGPPVLKNISIANTGSGSGNTGIIANPLRSYLMIHNPGGANIGVTLGGLTPSVGGPGTVTVVPNGALTYENGFIPKNAFSVCGSSGSGVTVWEG